MGVSSGLGGTHGFTFFWDQVRDSNAVKLAAVVYQRRQPEQKPRHPVRSLFRDFFGRAKDRSALEMPTIEEGFDGASDPGGRYEVLYSSTRQLVRVGGGDYPLPANGRTLVLLAEEPAE